MSSLPSFFPSSLHPLKIPFAGAISIEDEVFSCCSSRSCCCFWLKRGQNFISLCLLRAFTKKSCCEALLSAKKSFLPSSSYRHQRTHSAAFRITLGAEPSFFLSGVNKIHILAGKRAKNDKIGRREAAYLCIGGIPPGDQKFVPPLFGEKLV